MPEPSTIAASRTQRPPSAGAGLRLRLSCAALVAAGLIGACAGDAPRLNSERIEATFGNYGIEILEATDRKRIANLYSTKDGRRTTRTYAKVCFNAPIDDALREEHALVVSGQSLGEVFESRGWTVSKRNILIGSETLTGNERHVAALMRIDVPREVASHQYALFVQKDGRPFEYAVITELHHPEYLTVDDLEAIYGALPKTAK